MRKYLLRVTRNSIQKHFLLKSDSRWHGLVSRKIAKIIWPSYNLSSTLQPLNHSRRYLSKLLSIPIGHWLISKHDIRLVLIFNPHCRWCKDTGKEETVFYLLCECPALTIKDISTMYMKFLG